MKTDEVVPLLLAACPNALPKWREYSLEESAGPYLDISVFVHHIVDGYAEGRHDECPAFFAAIEKMIAEGDQDVIDLALAGLIEGVQNVASHESFGYHVFEQWLGPLGRRGWAEIEELWQGKASLADVLRAENQRREN